MFSFWRGLGAVFVLGSALWFAGCGGGSSGPTPTPTSTSRPTATPIAGNLIVVRLRDNTGAVVDGVVALTAGADTFRLGTTGGQASFVGFAAAAYAVSAQVNGRTQTKNITSTKGTTTVDLVFSTGITPTPAGTIPPPPF